MILVAGWWARRAAGVVLVGVLLGSVLVVGSGVSAQSAADVEVRDRLIADQENLLNSYRCLFGVDVQAVPGGCPEPDVVSPGAAPPNPTQRDIEVRDGLIQSQEALLNVYRCRFNVDTEIVPGGCPEKGVSQPTPDADLTPGSVVADGYSDVPSDHLNADSVDRLRRDGVLAGTDCADGRFCPDVPITGLAFATWLARVLDGRDSLDPLARLVELGVATDCGGQFPRLCSDGHVPRNQMATFFVRAFDLEEAKPTRLVDVAGDSPHRDNIDRLMATTIDPGCGYPSRFCPKKTVSRAQMADLLARAIDWQKARGEVAVTGYDDSIDLSVTYDEDKYIATISWTAPAGRRNSVDHYVVQSRPILEDFGPKSYQMVGAEKTKSGYRIAISNITNTNRLYAFRVITVYNNGERLASSEAKTPSKMHQLRDTIFENVVSPHQKGQPWLADTWTHMNDETRFDLGFGGSEVSLSSEYPYPNGLARIFVSNLSLASSILQPSYLQTVVHEMGHIYTLTNNISEDSAPIGIGHLYMLLLEINHASEARRPDKCAARELYADLAVLTFFDKFSYFDPSIGLDGRFTDGVVMTYWGFCRFRLDKQDSSAIAKEIPKIAQSVFIDQEIPQWFYDTYQKPDGDIDLKKLWVDINTDERHLQSMELITYHLRNEFGGYCSEEQVYKFIRGEATGITNPWKDGGCKDKVVIEEDKEATAPEQTDGGTTPPNNGVPVGGSFSRSYPMGFLERYRSSPDNCWIGVNGYVFDVTPGDDGYEYTGPGQITDLCGQDATDHFATNNLSLPPARFLKGALRSE